MRILALLLSLAVPPAGVVSLGVPGAAAHATPPPAASPVQMLPSVPATPLAPVAAVPVIAPVYVWNLYGAEEGRADRRPAMLVVSEFTALRDIVWRRWGPARAVGEGSAGGSWCLPHCLTRPYPATIRLKKVVVHQGRRYFTRYVIKTTAVPRAERAAAELKGALPLP